MALSSRTVLIILRLRLTPPIRQVSEAEFYNCVIEQARNLAEWWDELPDYLKLVPTSLPPYSPPSHIVILKYVTLTFYYIVHALTMPSLQFVISYYQYSSPSSNPLLKDKQRIIR